MTDRYIENLASKEILRNENCIINIAFKVFFEYLNDCQLKIKFNGYLI